MIDTLAAQHNDLLRLAAEMDAWLDTERVTRDPGGARAALARLVLELRKHLTTEAWSLYPRLFAAGDPAVRATASRFERDTWRLLEDVLRHMNSWPGNAAVGAHAARFTADTERMLAALRDHLTREDESLLPLLER